MTRRWGGFPRLRPWVDDYYWLNIGVIDQILVSQPDFNQDFCSLSYLHLDSKIKVVIHFGRLTLFQQDAGPNRETVRFKISESLGLADRLLLFVASS